MNKKQSQRSPFFRVTTVKNTILQRTLWAQPIFIFQFMRAINWAVTTNLYIDTIGDTVSVPDPACQDPYHPAHTILLSELMVYK
jgi:hypothetical protein